MWIMEDPWFPPRRHDVCFRAANKPIGPNTKYKQTCLTAKGNQRGKAEYKSALSSLHQLVDRWGLVWFPTINICSIKDSHYLRLEGQMYEKL